ncbi:MAG TPA: hypothetical protein P5246_06620 [Candidatus Omnitrophota bacterium]|jgi:hypothetical protein|nr:hypothetical protein [Candidatus Omnitrophota bacterium]HSA31712.1 hypothetical protein [Candidatus Omnitrophota bacterium]
MAYTCPLCRKTCDKGLKEYVDHVESEIVEIIKQEHPEWIEKNNMCPKCYEYFKAQLRGE